MGSCTFEDWVRILEPIHIFYEELPVDENDIFTADITEKHEVENVGLKNRLNMRWLDYS